MVEILREHDSEAIPRFEIVQSAPKLLGLPLGGMWVDREGSLNRVERVSSRTSLVPRLSEIRSESLATANTAFLCLVTVAQSVRAEDS